MQKMRIIIIRLSKKYAGMRLFLK